MIAKKPRGRARIKKIGTNSGGADKGPGPRDTQTRNKTTGPNANPPMVPPTTVDAATDKKATNNAITSPLSNRRPRGRTFNQTQYARS